MQAEGCRLILELYYEGTLRLTNRVGSGYCETYYERVTIRDT